MNPKDILNKYYHFVFIGVSPNKEKFGYKIYQRLKERVMILMVFHLYMTMLTIIYSIHL